MLTSTPLYGIMDIAQTAYENAAAAANAASSPTSAATAANSALLPEILEAAKERAAADKLKNTWVLVGVGAGGLVLGVLIGRYAVPKRKRR